MSALAELDAPHTIEPTVNYLVNDGAEIFNYTGGPGSTEVKTGGTLDPHKVTMHNARRQDVPLFVTGRFFSGETRRASDS